ncbi:hypothetical protein DSO57_1020987 [Entomophthora muscae]|uniref:Uncharacterized protein n=1 Tax=Entomophthora muscae TaxID=34485 RepID=A0ACC2UPH6_9FUNG|nr:hypothetical protein DSO57_1020987 [Entomophthora muscae]
MPHSVQIAFLNRLCSSKEQFLKQDCATTVAGSVTNSAPSSDAGNLFDKDSLFEEHIPVSRAPLAGSSSSALHPFVKRLPSSGVPCATSSSMLCTWSNLDKVPMDYPDLLSKFGMCHHEKTMYSFVQAMHSDKNAMTPICVGELYHGCSNASCLAAEVRLGLQSTSLVPGKISAQYAHTITSCNEFIDKVTQIWALELAANLLFHQTLYLPIQANTSWRFLATFKVFLSAVNTGDASFYLPLAAAACHFMWYTPDSYQPGQPGYTGCCLEHYQALAYQLWVPLPMAYSYMEDTLIDCLSIGAAFSDHGGWGCLVPVIQLCLPLCNWSSMLQNSQLAWAQMLVILAHVRQRLEDYHYLFPAHECPVISIQHPTKHPCHSDPSCSTHDEQNANSNCQCFPFVLCIRVLIFSFSLLSFILGFYLFYLMYQFILIFLSSLALIFFVVTVLF